MARRRKKRRRRNFGSILTVLTVLIVAGAIITSITVFLKVAKFEVVGTSKYSPAEIIEASGIKTGENMFSVNKFKVSSNILKKFPYIGQIKINRRFPDTFIFTVTERTPAGYIEADDRIWLVASDGYLLESFERAEFKLVVPQIVGASLMSPLPGSKVSFEEQGKIPALSEITSGLHKHGLIPQINLIDISKLYSLSFTYQNRLKVVLGDVSDINAKIKMFNAVRDKLKETDKGTVTLTNPGEARFKPE
ncbi:MAG: FtsQ-type POTRA domain-containing protein [Clostridiales bacterium]|nr:FtsQ-type POTRA domain-containing protein [Clostridiales bacterium]